MEAAPRYLDRLRNRAAARDWRAILQQILASLEWRLSPRHRVMRAVMRENTAFDLQHGTDTSGELPLDKLGFDTVEARHGNGVYRAIPTSHFHAALSLLDLRFQNYTFVDYGSGKGKALLLACDYPFRRIAGVEYSRTLHAAARENIAHYPIAATHRGPVTSQHGDARSYEPPAGPLVCFFFNPFDATIWRQVLGRLRSSFEATPRPIHIVYVNVRDVGELEDLFPEFTVFVAGPRTQTVRILSAMPAAQPLQMRDVDTTAL